MSKRANAPIYQDMARVELPNSVFYAVADENKRNGVTIWLQTPNIMGSAEPGQQQSSLKASSESTTLRVRLVSPTTPSLDARVHVQRRFRPD